MSEVERPKSGLSQASSIVTVSSIALGSKPTRSVKKVHTFGKREHSIRRDPNSTVVIRGWLYKQDSSGLKLWKRRWFVLSNFCMFYYRDSREETVLGSIPMPSYRVLPAEPKEVKNRRFVFKAEHTGMRTYYFSADTQEDMSGWVRAMNQSARVEMDSHSKVPSLSDITCTLQDGRYTSYEDFTHPGLVQNKEHAKSAESLEITELSEKRGKMDFPEERLPEAEETGRMMKKMPRLFVSMEHCIPHPQSGAAPPPTPVNGVQDGPFHYERGIRPARVEEERQSLLHVEEWVRSQKEKMSLNEPSRASYHCAKNPTGMTASEQECPQVSYQSPPQISYSHSVITAPGSLSQPENYSQEKVYHLKGAEQQQEKKQDSSEWLCQGTIRQDAVSSDLTHYHERPSYLSQTEVESSTSRPVRVIRSSSLPLSPSEGPTSQPLKRPNTPDNRMRAQATDERTFNYVAFQEERPAQRSQSLSCSPVERIQAPSQRLSGQSTRTGQTSQVSLGRLEVDSSEDLSLTSSFGTASRSLIRPHTPVGRVDIHPAEDISGGGYIQSSKHLEDKPAEHPTATLRTRTQLVGPPSRPQTPSDRYDVLPSEDTVWSFSQAKPFNHLSKQNVKSPQAGPVEERHVEESSMTLPCRAHGTSSRLHGRSSTPVDRVAFLPPVDRQAETHQMTPSLGRHRNQASRQLSLYQERCYTPQPPYATRATSTPRLQGKMLSTHSASAAYAQLPPLPPVSARANPQGQSVRRLTLATMVPSSEMYRERIPQPVRITESDVDVLLTRLCGQDKLLQGLAAEAGELKADKERLESALEMTRMQMEEFKDQPIITEKIAYQQRLLQDDMISIRAKLCDLSTEIEKAWNDYTTLENELHVHRASLEQIQYNGHLQEQSEAQRQLWMMEDIMSGLMASKNNLQVAIESARHPVMAVLPSPPLERCPSLQSSLLHLSAFESPNQQRQLVSSREPPRDTEVAPPRPPLPKAPTPPGEDEPTSDGTGRRAVTEQRAHSGKKTGQEKEGKELVNGNRKTPRTYYREQGLAAGPAVESHDLSAMHSPEPVTAVTPNNSRGQAYLSSQGPSSTQVSQSSSPSSYVSSQWRTTDPGYKAQSGNGMDTLSRKARMSAEEQLERIQKHQKAQIHERVKSVTLGQRRISDPQQGNAKPQASNSCKPMDTSPCHTESNTSQNRVMANLFDSNRADTIRMITSYVPTAMLLSSDKSDCIQAAAETPPKRDTARCPDHGEVVERPLIRQKAHAEQTGCARELGVLPLNSTSPSSTGSITTVNIKPISMPAARVASPVRTSSKLLTVKSSPQSMEDAGIRHSTTEDMVEFKQNKMVVTARYMEVDPDATLTPDQLEAKQKKVEKIKTMVARTS